MCCANCKLGLTKERIDNQDVLFFYQLLLPIVDHKRSGIDEGPTLAYYSTKNQHNNKYALLDRNLDVAYGYQWKPSTPMEHFVFDGIVFENTAENIHDSWRDDDLNG